MGRFDLDRTELPKFWATMSGKNAHNLRPGTVLVESSEHSNPDWITLGYVSFQTPYGQGTYMGFPRSEVRPATKDEILAALLDDHPHGDWFRPHNLEASDIGFQLVMSEAIGNWTTDGSSSREYGSVLPFSRRQLMEAQNQAIAKHEAIMDRWSEITTLQFGAIVDWILRED